MGPTALNCTHIVNSTGWRACSVGFDVARIVSGVTLRYAIEGCIVEDYRRQALASTLAAPISRQRRFASTVQICYPLPGISLGTSIAASILTMPPGEWQRHHRSRIVCLRSYESIQLQMVEVSQPSSLSSFLTVHLGIVAFDLAFQVKETSHDISQGRCWSSSREHVSIDSRSNQPRRTVHRS